MPKRPKTPAAAEKWWTVAQAAKAWNVTSGRVSQLITEGRVPKSIVFLGRRVIPAGTPKPAPLPHGPRPKG